MRILSVFDGMACGMLAFQAAGIKVDRYVAYEYDEDTVSESKGRPYGFAALTSAHNFPMIEHRGNVFQADFTEFSGFDFVIGGSPCTYWSIAQKNNRETEASGMGWELFCQFVRAVKEAQPMYFIYENNKSMSKAIRESITKTFGFEPICINSALVSAQNRQRLYWVGKRNLDGTYSKVHVDQPEDRGILLRDVLDGQCWLDKSYTIDSNYHKTLGQQGFDRQSGRRKMVAESVAEPFGETNGKAYAPTASYWKGQPHNKILEKAQRTHIAEPVAEPIYIGEVPGHNGQYRNGKQPSQQYRVYSTDGKSVACDQDGRKYIAQPVPASLIEQPFGNMYEKQGQNGQLCDTYFAKPLEWDENGKPIKAISGADGKPYPVYEVKDGQITIKGKQYPIKLADGFYIIRKLTISECKRLQTVPEWYEFPVSDTQAYKMLGNGWTVEVIAHLINATQCDIEAEEQISFFEGGI